MNNSKSDSSIDLRPIVQLILADYQLDINRYHGVSHWARVLENGMRLISRSTGANAEIVRLFAVFHDSKRINEDRDPGHGQRGADFAKALRGRDFDLPDDDFELLYRACAGHTDERNNPDLSIKTCWDSDRLDIGRVGFSRPKPHRLCTAQAMDDEMINWADERARRRAVPGFVLEEWGVDLENR